MEHDRVNELYRTLGPLIRSRCARLLGDPGLAEDATQEVFIRMIRKAGDLPDATAYLKWLYRVSTNYCLNWIRDNRRLEYRAPEELPERGRAPELEERLALRQVLDAVLHDADERMQQVFVYAFVDGLTQDEVADLIGVSRRAVVKRIKRLRDRLERQLGGAP